VMLSSFDTAVVSEPIFLPLLLMISIDPSRLICVLPLGSAEKWRWSDVGGNAIEYLPLHAQRGANPRILHQPADRGSGNVVALGNNGQGKTTAAILYNLLPVHIEPCSTDLPTL